MWTVTFLNVFIALGTKFVPNLSARANHCYFAMHCTYIEQVERTYLLFNIYFFYLLSITFKKLFGSCREVHEGRSL